MAVTYATRANCLAYIEGLAIASGGEDAFDRLIERAEGNVDRALGLYERDEDTGRKLAPAELTTAQARALMRATCAQVEFRLEMGEAYFVRPQYDSVSGPDFTTTGKLPMIGPKVWEELEGSGLLQLSTTWGRPNTGAPPWESFARNMD